MLLLGLEVPLWVALIAVAMPLLYWYGTSTHGVFKKMGVPSLTPLPFLGNLTTQMTMPFHEYSLLLKAKLPGKTYGCLLGWGLHQIASRKVGYQLLTTWGPAVQTQKSFQGRTPILAVADVDMMKQITIKDFSSFTNHQDFIKEKSLFTRNVGFIKDAHWKHIRSILSPNFTSGKLKSMYPQVSVCADKLLAHVKSKASAPVDIKKFMEGYTMDVIASAAFGMDIDAQSSTDHPFVLHARPFVGVPNKRSKIKLGFVLLSLFIMPKALQKFLGLFMDMSFVEQDSLDYFENIIDQIFSQTQSQQTERKNFISICAEKLVDEKSPEAEAVTSPDGLVWSSKGLTRDDIIANSFIFFSAGYETTASSLQFFFYNMALNPDVQEKLYHVIQEVEIEKEEITYEQLKNIDYMEWCINENLRIFPPAARVDRVANQETTVDRVTIPKGMIVDVMIYLIHHDPEYWPDPEKYDPERFSPENMTETQRNAFIPFGSGNRSCIASRLALLELRVAVFKMIKAFQFKKAPDTPEKEDIKFASGLGLMTPAEPIKLVLVPRD